MIKYRKNSSWGLSRNFKKSPHQALLSLEPTPSEAVYFKLKGQAFLFCHFEQLHALQLFTSLDHQPLPLEKSRQISHFQLQNSDFVFQFSEWLSTLQRFLAVALTHHIESKAQPMIEMSQIVQAPIEWTLFHLSMQCDLRKATRTNDRQMVKIVESFQRGLKSPYTRLFPSVYGFNSWRLNHGNLSKKLQQVQSETPGLSVEDCYAFTEWQKHLSETITWTLLLLEQFPQLMDDLKRELNEVLSNQAYQAQSIFKLPKLVCFIYETLRLFPPSWLSLWGQISEFHDQKDLFQVDQTGLNDQTIILSTPLHSHYQEQDWPSPHTFRPERFLAIFYGAQAPKSFLPFGTRSKGHTLSLVSLHTIAAVLSSILRRGRLRIDPTSWQPLQFPISYGPNSVEEWIGSGFGIPPQIKGRFSLDESYIYIPSARV